jgi:iron complex transport system permease protein
VKVTLDLDALVAAGKLSDVEAARLQTLAAADTGALGTNIFLGFGAVAVALGVGVFLPTPQTAIVIGALFAGLGLALTLTRSTHWAVFAQIVTVIGALGILGGVFLLSAGSIWINLAMTAILAATAVVASSGLLAALSVLMLAVALGSAAPDWQSSWFLGFDRPAMTIAALSLLTLALYLVSLRLKPAQERLAIIAMRTAILMVNAVFAIGSLFGDAYLGWPAQAFSIGWAVALVCVGVWAIVVNRRWLVNAVAVFAAIHFFFRWFELIGPNPVGILGAGLLLIAFGLGLARFNRWVGARRERLAAA